MVRELKELAPNSQIFKEKTDLMCRLKTTHIKVYLPENLKNYESITLVARIETDPTRIHSRHYLIVNNFDREKYFIKPNVHYRINVNTNKSIRTIHYA